ncbi:DUF4199 domain-containing protein [Litoribacter populi]|uniref:DUF4199 domain-containing protein n=1 Tax=Litoribacter populi TaxID=2598460 RepID=UPI00117E06D2|nr:DUF4199 domain-containing protein [Litoribacter populi]
MEQIRAIDPKDEPVISPLNAAIQPGIVLGLVSTAISFMAYFIDFSLLASSWFGFASFGIMLGIIIYFGIEYRKEVGGFLNFGKAFKFSFVALLISGLISTIGSLLLFNVIDPSLSTALADVLLENTLAIMDKFGAGSALSADQIDEMRTGFYENYTVLGIFKSYGFYIIPAALISLIAGGIIKKKDKSLEN